MWKKIKALKEERGELRNKATAYITKAETEKRDLTPDEKKAFDDLVAKVTAISDQVDRLEQVQGMGSEKEDRFLAAMKNGGASEGDLHVGEQRTQFPNNDDKAETRALRPGETCAQFVRSRGLVKSEKSEVTFGGFLRAIAAGPKSEGERRALSTLSLGAGGYTTNAELSAEWIDALRPQSVVMQAGAKLAVMTADKHYIARLATPPAASFIGELDDVPEATAVFDRVELTARDVVCYVTVSRALLADGVNVEEILSTSLAKAVAQEIDRAALVGTGTGNQPLGIVNQSGISTVSMGTNGGTLTYDAILDAAYAVSAANGGDVNALVLNPRSALALAKLKDSTGQSLAKPESLAALKLLSTTSIPITDTQGTATGVASKAIVGKWDNLIVGVRLEPRIEISNQPLLNQKLQVGFIVWARIDIGVSQPKAFTKIVGIIP